MDIEQLQQRVATIELLPKQKKFMVNALYNKDIKFLWYVGGFGS
jgi:hypothetical protein